MAKLFELIVSGIRDFVRREKDVLIPPKRKIFIGDGDFEKIGEEFFRYFTGLSKLKPNEKVLDVGCGIGRMAVPLTRYLSDEGSYEGLDIVPEGIKWCQKKIARTHPNFHFQLADVFNGNYHPQGRHKASEYRFPYRDESFDFVFLTSVFTHMLPRDMENYFGEIARVLKGGGKCFITFFLINSEAMKLMREKKSTLDFKYELEGFRTTHFNMPEAAVGYEESYILDLYKKHGLRIEQPIHYGAWCGRPDFLSGQDIIISSKE